MARPRWFLHQFDFNPFAGEGPASNATREEGSTLLYTGGKYIFTLPLFVEGAIVIPVVGYGFSPDDAAVNALEERDRLRRFLERE